MLYGHPKCEVPSEAHLQVLGRKLAGVMAERDEMRTSLPVKIEGLVEEQPCQGERSSKKDQYITPETHCNDMLTLDIMATKKV